jgi:hypothetical protein
MTGDADRPTEEDRLAMDDGDSETERNLFTVEKSDSTTQGNRSTAPAGEASSQDDPLTVGAADRPNLHELSGSVSAEESPGRGASNSLVEVESTRSDPIESPPSVTVLKDDSARPV